MASRTEDRRGPWAICWCFSSLLTTERSLNSKACHARLLDRGCPNIVGNHISPDLCAVAFDSLSDLIFCRSVMRAFILSCHRNPTPQFGVLTLWGSRQSYITVISVQFALFCIQWAFFPLLSLPSMYADRDWCIVARYLKAVSGELGEFQPMQLDA
ncbi:hypothetical protein BDV33DRAFT_183921 [Aspergillus novoparasiticus]|uniref:Uncharacterized protein n=1 Tax=Aspergillus novoparasiticus TaxID=986946 RepID=A0A5N6E8A8_9EURO|nr:hypothetical protein BDV33DRAFT_183921 [Aspergillus novoparasiticus]